MLGGVGVGSEKGASVREKNTTVLYSERINSYKDTRFTIGDEIITYYNLKR